MRSMIGCMTGTRCRRLAGVVVAAALAAAPAVAQQVQLTHLSDVAFGTISNLGVDQVQSQSVCAYSGLLGGRYSVSATGSGTGGAFTLASGSATMPYEVQWSGTAGQTSGTAMTPGAALTGQTMLLSCPVLGSSDASLILVLRALALSSATAGNYSGTLTIILSAN
jgi:hypothetical protein